MEAILRAVAKALSMTGANGSHKLSIMIIVDGYEHTDDGYDVSVRLSVVDFDPEQDDIYHEKAEDMEERHDHSEAFVSAFYASAFGVMAGRAKDAGETVENMVENGLERKNIISSATEDISHRIRLLASSGVHNILEDEIMRQRSIMEFHNDAPTLDLGGTRGVTATVRDEAA